MRKLIAIAVVLSIVSAHAGHHHVEEGSEANSRPIDWITWLHIVTQATVWLVLFPLGLVLGLIKSKWHVPLQSSAILVTSILGYLSGMKHKGRQFPKSVHSTMATLIIFYLILQALMGIFLKLHIYENTKFRKFIVKFHGYLGLTFPIVGWVQVVFGVATVGTFCRGGALGQCLAHYIMGSAFIGYGILYAVLLHIGAQSVLSNGKSQEFIDSTVIMLWGIVNTFTEHHGGPWSHKDLQHTMLGVLWWCGGALGMFMSRNGVRSIIPAGIIIMTGYVMSAHSQALEISTRIHAIFGYTLMTAGITRIIEIVFMNDNNEQNEKFSSFKHLPPYLLILSGSLFMSATDEELTLADRNNFDHATYAMIIFSFSFLVYLLLSTLINLYTHMKRPQDNTNVKNITEEDYERLSMEERNHVIFDNNGQHT